MALLEDPASWLIDAVREARSGVAAVAFDHGQWSTSRHSALFGKHPSHEGKLGLCGTGEKLLLVSASLSPSKPPYDCRLSVGQRRVVLEGEGGENVAAVAGTALTGQVMGSEPLDDQHNGPQAQPPGIEAPMPSAVHEPVVTASVRSK